MSKFIATNRSNDCPVCGDVSGKCRTKNDGEQKFILCMTNGDAKLFDVVSGHKCIKPGSKGWATFTLDEAQTQQSQEERQQRRAQREAEEKAVYQAGLSITERHTAYSQIANQLSLHPEDKADLQRRGLSEDTISTFASIKPWQPLSQPVSDRTPGSNGQKLLTKHSGYLVPARDVEGRVTGYQIRNRNTGEGQPKYPWLSTSSRPVNIQNGELPITYIDGGAGTELNLCEGILKPLVAAERHSAKFIGASGGNFASSPEQLRQCIYALLPKTIVLCPDGGSLANRQVMHQYGLLADLVSEIGHELKVRWWGQTEKSHGDVDEITPEQFAAADLIGWSEFVAKTQPKVGGEHPKSNTISVVKKLDNKAKKQQTKAEWKRKQHIERDRRAYEKIAATLDIETVIDTTQEGYKEKAKETFYQPLKQYLKYETAGKLINGFASEIKPAVEGRSLIAYDCSQGTGKSNNALIPLALRTARQNGRVLIIVPTRGLAREFKGRINERAGEDIAATHLDSNYYSAAITVTCPESTYKFKGQNFEALLIDEANEVLHRVESAELGNAGPQSLKAFRKLAASTKVVAIATAAMSGRSLAAMQAIGGFTLDETLLQRRSRPSTQMSVIKYDNYYQWLQQIVKAVRSGQRIAIPIGSQGKGRAIDRMLRVLFPKQDGLVIDGKATLQNQRSRFLADPDAFLTDERPDWFIYTPVINSGVSIEGRHFDIQFEYATPHEGAQSVSQRGERIRSSIGRDGAITERHIYFSQQGAPTLEAYPDALNWQYWAEELDSEANAPMSAAAALGKALGAEKALNPMKGEAEKFAAMRLNLPHFLSLKAFEIVYKKELLLEDWQRYGWQVSTAPPLEKEQLEQLQDLKALCEKIKIGLIEQTGRVLKKAKTRESEEEIEEIDNPFQAARAAKLQLEKLLGKDYLSKQDDQFYTAWGADKSANNPGVRGVVRSQLLAIATNDPECFQQIERMKALKFLAGKPATESDNSWHLPELPGAARDIELASIISRCPGIAAVVKGELAQWTNKDPQVLAAGLYLIAHAKQIAANTKKSGLMRGAKFSEQMAPAALFNKALELMGYTPRKEKRQGSGSRLNVYQLQVASDVLAAVEKLKQGGPNPLKLFRAELKIIRAQSRQSIDAAARSQIIRKALNWVSGAVGIEVGKAIAEIKKRHADQIELWLSKLGDASQMGAGELPESINQMALIGSNITRPPSPPPNS
ncbi:MAG: DEAD/DEAH box helicase [Cyanobacteria bacterium J06607_10]